MRLGWPGAWGIVGVLALLGQAIYKLAPYALALREMHLNALELVALIGWVAFNAFAEGYRGFQRRFSPRVVVRAQCLTSDPRPLFVVLAPLYCMGMIHATRRRLIVSWCLAVGIVAIVILVRRLDQPWRGIVDTGVVVGLAWGALSIAYYVARALAGRAMPVPPDLPNAR